MDLFSFLRGGVREKIRGSMRIPTTSNSKWRQLQCTDPEEGRAGRQEGVGRAHSEVLDIFGSALQLCHKQLDTFIITWQHLDFM